MSKVISRDGTAIAFDQIGAGPAIILVDGALCSRAGGPMPSLAPLLAQHCTVFTYDRRGRNESGDTAPYAVAREVEDIAALIAEAGGSAYVYGISSGAVLAVDAAAQLPGISKLAIYEPPLLLDDSRPPIPADYLAQFYEMNATGRRGDMVAHFMVQGVGMPAEMVAGMRHAPMWAGLEAVAPTLIYDTIIMGDFGLSPDLISRLSAIKVRALVMGGGASPQQLKYAAQVVAENIPGADFRLLAGQTHDVDAAVLAPVLLEFFQG